MNGEMGIGLYLAGYDRYRATQYARRWANGRNRLFGDFSGVGGDCTNFVSQAVFAGSCVMNYTYIFGWYFRSLEDRAPAWTGVEALYDFMTGSGDFPPTSMREGPFGYEVGREGALLGDVVQLVNAEGDYYHTLIITGFSADDILVCAHSVDSLDRPLSSYVDAVGERIIHVAGVMAPDDEPPESLGNCYEGIING